MNVIGIKKELIAKIDPNPFRDLANYPVIRAKVEALKSSIGTVGLWPSIIVRPHPDRPGRFEQAFGHQRKVASEELGLTEIDAIVCNMTDEEMVMYMGRENGEDYSADFQIMLNTWEAGMTFFAEREKKPKDVEVARLLGWTRMSGNHDVMSDLATACAGAHALIEGGHLERKDLSDISVRVARDIVTRALSRISTIEQQGKLSGAKAADIKQAKQMVGHGVRATVKQVRKGEIATSKAAASVDTNTLAAAGKAKAKPDLLFVAFGYKLAESINKMLALDPVAERLREIEKVLDYVVDPQDKTIVRQIHHELTELELRALDWRNRLTPNKVKPFPAPVQIGGPSS